MMSLSSWPPTGYNPQPTDPQKQSSQPVLLGGETKDQVYEDLLQEFAKFLPAVYNIRQRHLMQWRSRYKKAK